MNYGFLGKIKRKSDLGFFGILLLMSSFSIHQHNGFSVEGGHLVNAKPRRKGA